MQAILLEAFKYYDACVWEKYSKMIFASKIIALLSISLDDSEVKNFDTV